MSDARIADIAIAQEGIIEDNKVTDWDRNLDIQKRIKSQLDECFYDLERESRVELDMDRLDVLIDQVLEIAKARGRQAS